MMHDLSLKLEKAKNDMIYADNLIKEFMPFILSTTSKVTKKSVNRTDDETSISMIAFHEAIKSYDKEKGSFLAYSSIVMRNRLIDYFKKEEKHKNVISLDTKINDEDNISLIDTIEHKENQYENLHNLKATKEEIFELTRILNSFGVGLIDISENSPKQERTIDAIRKLLNYAIQNKEILNKIEKTGKIPIAELSKNTGVSKKTIERHRKYILAMFLIQTNGYEIIRDHISKVIKVKGGAA